MASSMLDKVTCLAMICLVLGIPLANAAPSCVEMEQTLIPCLEYATHPGPPPPPEPCCNAIKTLHNQTHTPQDRRDCCGCVKFIIIDTPGLNLPAVAAMPKDCGVDLGYEISPDMDCSKYISHHQPSFFISYLHYYVKFIYSAVLLHMCVCFLGTRRKTVVDL
jgi:hypothetical protein